MAPQWKLKRQLYLLNALLIFNRPIPCGLLACDRPVGSWLRWMPSGLRFEPLWKWNHLSYHDWSLTMVRLPTVRGAFLLPALSENQITTRDPFSIQPAVTSLKLKSMGAPTTIQLMPTRRTVLHNTIHVGYWILKHCLPLMRGLYLDFIPWRSETNSRATRMVWTDHVEAIFCYFQLFFLRVWSTLSIVVLFSLYCR